MEKLICTRTIEFLHNSFPAKSWQDPANIDILWVAIIGCQYWQDPGMDLAGNELVPNYTVLQQNLKHFSKTSQLDNSYLPIRNNCKD